MKYLIKVPATSANLGPGFDSIGLALKLYLKIELEIKDDNKEDLKMEFKGEGANILTELRIEENLIYKVIQYALKIHDKSMLLSKLVYLKFDNEIPLSRGLGSSASAVIAGVEIANLIAKLELNEKQKLNLALEFENHPDNLASCLVGGLVSSFVSDGKGSFIKQLCNPNIKAVVLIPQYDLSTVKARQALPSSYSREEAIFNLQRLSVLIPALCAQNLDRELIHEGMKDALHQPYRANLMPGFNQILEELTLEKYGGLLGVCLSGAGPTVLIFAHKDVDLIFEAAEEIMDRHLKDMPKTTVLMLDFDVDGVTVKEI